MPNPTYARLIFQRIGLSREAADELEVLLDVMRPAGLMADDVADQIVRYASCKANTAHQTPACDTQYDPSQLPLFATPLLR